MTDHLHTPHEGIVHSGPGWRELRCECGAFFRFPVAEPILGDREVAEDPYPTGEWVTDHDRDLRA
jgi:hypothetical protein